MLYCKLQIELDYWNTKFLTFSFPITSYWTRKNQNGLQFFIFRKHTVQHGQMQSEQNLKVQHQNYLSMKIINKIIPLKRALFRPQNGQKDN